MKERPILFSAPMVQAILAGRKTQTRRKMPQPFKMPNAKLGIVDGVVCRLMTEDEINATTWMPGRKPSPGWIPMVGGKGPGGAGNPVRCPYGVPGDRLRMLTTWAVDSSYDSDKPKNISLEDAKIWGLWHAGMGAKKGGWGKSRPGRFMPLAFRQFMPLLEITEVRLQRLQDISEEEARAEGVLGFSKDGSLYKYWPCDPCDGPLKCAWADLPRSAVQAFKVLWDSINGPGSWDQNPWVWALTFKRVEGDK